MLRESYRKPGSQPQLNSQQPQAAEKIITSVSLFGGDRNEIVIEHRGEQYRLRHTRNGKLILTK